MSIISILVMSVFSIWATVTSIEYVIVANQKNKIEKEIFATYKEIYPNIGKNSNIEHHIRSTLQQYFQVQGTDSFAVLIADLNQAIYNIPQTKILSFGYKNKTINAKVETADIGGLGQLISQLEKKHIQISEKIFDHVNGKVYAQFTLLKM